MPKEPIVGVAIYPDKRVEDVTLTKLEDYQKVVVGYIEAVALRFGTMYVNEEFLLGQFGPEDFNSIATDVCGLGGRPDLMFSGILGPVVVVGEMDEEGYDLTVNRRGRKAIERVRREAGVG